LHTNLFRRVRPYVLMSIELAGVPLHYIGLPDSEKPISP
jgi:hypothetical protein